MQSKVKWAARVSDSWGFKCNTHALAEEIFADLLCILIVVLDVKESEQSTRPRFSKSQCVWKERGVLDEENSTIQSGGE